MIKSNATILRNLGINSLQEAIVYLRVDCFICQSEGFLAQSKVLVTLKNQSLIATLHTVDSSILKPNEASLSLHAWNTLGAQEGDEITITHPEPIESIQCIRSKIYGNELKYNETESIIRDVVSSKLSTVNIGMFIASCIGNKLTPQEVMFLTQAMIKTGQKLIWSSPLIVDKHSIGGLPGNRTTPIVVAIVAAFGLYIPKTSSRSITSPAGTADTMEVFTNVSLDINSMRKIVEKERGCVAWGGSISLSPADDLFIRLLKTMNLHSTGQMVASILSKKIAAGCNHIVLDVPVGPTAKICSLEDAKQLKQLLQFVARQFDVEMKVLFSDGSQPIGYGIGPALEAQDIWAVLNNTRDAPADLRDNALHLAAEVIEFSPKVKRHQGLALATEILQSGKALTKFEAICEAQGGLRKIPKAEFTYTVEANYSGTILQINNQYIATTAKLAGAPEAKAAGIKMLVKLNNQVEKGQPLLILHAQTQSQLNRALGFLHQGHEIFQIEEN